MSRLSRHAPPLGWALAGLAVVIASFAACRNFNKPYEDYCAKFGCDGGVIFCDPSKKAEGATCQMHSECCSNQCNFQTGAPSGTCGPVLTGNCAGMGASCLAQSGGPPPTCCGGSFCGNSGTCEPMNAPDGGFVLGAPCTGAAQCASGHCSEGVCCDTQCGAPCDTCRGPQALGYCQVAPIFSVGMPGCEPYRCTGNGNACGTTCSGDAQCNGVSCVAGACGVKKPVGASCSNPTECQKGHCVDGVCCENACTNACATCDSPGAAGACLPEKAGTMPGISSPPCNFVCNGQGLDCPPSCGDDFDCFPGNYCNSQGQCAPLLNNGTPCDRPGQCVSTYCSDNICCDQACDLPCDTCSAPGGTTLGTCTNRMYADPGVPMCPAPTDGGFAFCSGTSPSCPSTCTDGSCPLGTYCDTDTTSLTNGQCRALPDIGQPCSGATGCKNGTCVDGICCREAACGGCGQCNQAGFEGTCMPKAQSAGGFCGAPILCDGRDQRCPCVNHTDCFGTEYCGLDGYCEPDKKDGEPCDFNQQCPSDLCQDSQCQ